MLSTRSFANTLPEGLLFPAVLLPLVVIPAAALTDAPLLLPLLECAVQRDVGRLLVLAASLPAPVTTTSVFSGGGCSVKAVVADSTPAAADCVTFGRNERQRREG